MSDGSEQEGVLQLGPVQLTPGTRIGSYVYERPVAAGGMAHVLLARDPGGQPVALKMLKANRVETGRQRFAREFRALRRLRHDNVIRVDASGDFHGHPYIVMEYVEGRDLHMVIRSMSSLGSKQRFERVEEILIDLAQALAYIHKRGLVHRDLKPSNILITPEGAAKLTDFGIVKDLDPSANYDISTTLVGTWAYASPEQISGAPIDHRSDLYSLGVLLYAMLTGRRPFVASDMGGYLEQHRTRKPLPPGDLDAQVPAHLQEICLKLLEKAPRDRYQGAREVLQRIEAIDPERSLDGAALGRAQPTDEQLWEPPLVGRTTELAALKDAVSALTRGSGAILTIEGPEGAGRTRLFDVAIRHARVIGLPVYSGRVTPRDGGFETLLRVARDISRELGARTPTELGRALAAFQQDQSKVSGDLRYQLYDAIRAALALLLLDGPQVIALDDLQHAPPALLGLLGYLGRTLIEREGAPVLILVTIQDGGASPGLDAFRLGSDLERPPTRLPLSPLGIEDVELVVQDVLGQSAESRGLAHRMHQELGGNPLLISEHLRGVLQRFGEPGALGGADEDTAMVPLLQEQETEVLAASDVNVPIGVQQLLAARVKRLEVGERDIISVLAANGREMDLDLLLDVVLDETAGGAITDRTRLPTEIAGDPDLSLGDGGDAEEALDIIEDLQSKGMLLERRVGLNSLVDFSHRRLGEVVYGDLSDARRANLHRRIGLAMEAREGHNPLATEVMAEHFRLAGDAGRAYHHLARAAEGLYARTLLAEAWKLAEGARALEFEARRELALDDFDQCRRSVLRVRGEVLFNRGKWVEAHECFSALRGEALKAQDHALAALAGLRIGECKRRMGRPEEAEEIVQHILTQARADGDRKLIVESLRRLAGFAFAEGDLDRCERYATEGLVAATGTEMEPLRAGILIALAVTQASRGELAAATSGLTEAEGILRGLRRKRATALVLGNLAELLTWQGQIAEAIQRTTEGLERASDVLFVAGEAFLHRVRGVAHLDAGDLATAQTELQHSLETCEQDGDTGELAAVQYFLARLALRRGRAEEALEHVEAGLAYAEQNDAERYHPALRATLARVLCVTGDLDRAEEILETLEDELPGLPLPRRTQVQLNMAAAWAAIGLADEALPLARRAAQVAGSRGFRTWALRARVLLSELASGAEAEHARAEAAAIAHSLLDGLPGDLAGCFRRQPGFARLWVVHS